MITITRQQYVTSAATTYKATRNGRVYYITEHYGDSVYVSQCYTSRLGRKGERRLPNGKVRDLLLAALSAHKAAHIAA